MKRETEDRFVFFATRPDAAWAGNFRDLAASVTRMATLAPRGRITTGVVEAEIEQLSDRWAQSGADPSQSILRDHLSNDAISEIDLFDRAQLAQALETCRSSSSLSDAGRKLFQASRERRSSTNDSDRLRKYLAKFGLIWTDIEAI